MPLSSLFEPLREFLGGGTLTVWLVVGAAVAMWLALKAARMAVRVVLGGLAMALFVGTGPWAGGSVQGAAADCAAAAVAAAAGGWQTTLTKRVTTETVSPDATCREDGTGLAAGTAVVRLRSFYDVPLQTWDVTRRGATPRSPLPTPDLPGLPDDTGGDAAPGATVTPPVDGTWQATVDRVVDGDTVVLRVADPRDTAVERGTRVRARLLRIDAPEVARDGRPGECLAARATQHLRRLLPAGSTVTAAWDVERRDRYDRELVHLWRDGTWVNGTMLRDGFATVVTVPPNVAHGDAARAMEERARDVGAGLWSAC